MKLNLHTLKSSIGLGTDEDSSKIHLDPARDWLFLLLLFFILTIGVSVYSYIIFIGIHTEDTNNVTEENTTMQIKYNRFQKEISTTLNFYEQKETAYKQLLEENSDSLKDPSLSHFESEEENENDAIVEEEIPVLTQ